VDEETGVEVFHCGVFFRKVCGMLPCMLSWWIFFYLNTFYICCFLYPSYIGDFKNTLGIEDYYKRTDVF